MPKRLIDLTEADALSNGDDLVYVRQASGSRRDRKISTKRLLAESYSDIGGITAPWDPEDEMPLPVLVWRRAAGVLTHGWLDLTEWLRSRLATVDSTINVEKMARENADTALAHTDTVLDGRITAEVAARESADDALGARVDALETKMLQTRIPDTGTAALKFYGATEAGSLTDLDVPRLGTVYQWFYGILSLFSTFSLNSASIVSSTRSVELHIHDANFGLWALAIQPTVGIHVRQIPVLVQFAGFDPMQLILNLVPPVEIGGDAKLELWSRNNRVTYADLFTMFGSSFSLTFSINFSTPVIPVA